MGVPRKAIVWNLLELLEHFGHRGETRAREREWDLIRKPYAGQGKVKLPETEKTALE